MPDDRRWTQEIARLRVRALKVRRRPPGSGEHDDVLDAALETCDALVRELARCHIENETLTRRCNAEAATYAHLFEHLPIAAIETDATALILAANRAAGLLLNTSTKYLTNRVLLHFAEDRAAFIRLLSAVSTEHSERGHVLKFRPRERAPLYMSATVIRSALHDPSTWVWFLSPVFAKDEPAPQRDFQHTGVEA